MPDSIYGSGLQRFRFPRERDGSCHRLTKNVYGVVIPITVSPDKINGHRTHFAEAEFNQTKGSWLGHPAMGEESLLAFGMIRRSRAGRSRSYPTCSHGK